MAAVFLGLMVAFGASADEVLDKAKALLDGGQGRQAYALLSPMEDKRAGEPDYDFLLGLSALEAGKPGMAVFALERVLAVQPDNARARAEIGRAYFLLRDDKLARQEFEQVKRERVPAPVEKAVDKYLEAIGLRFERGRTTWRFYVEGGGGVDDNVNAATSDTQFVSQFPLPGTQIPLAAANRSTSASFVNAAGGAAVTYSETPNLYLFLAADVNRRENVSKAFDTGSVDARGGVRYLSGSNAFMATAFGQKYDLDGDVFRDMGGVGLQVEHTVDEANQVSGFMRYANMRYPTARVRDVGEWIYGGSWAHAFGGKGSPLLFASAYHGIDENRRTGATYYARGFNGVRVSGQYSPDRTVDFIVSAGVQSSYYRGVDPVVGDAREDHFYDLTAGFNYKLAKSWTLRPRFQMTRNDSNNPLDDYNRHQLSISARYDF